jgi:hypothetical protein
MRPEEARIGRRMRVRNDHRKADFRGREGTIAKRWGDPGYPALDVLLDDGRWQLFWFHELEPVDKDETGARRQNGPRRGTRHENWPPYGTFLVDALVEGARVTPWLAASVGIVGAAVLSGCKGELQGSPELAGTERPMTGAASA